MTQLTLDRNGFPVLLADTKPKVVETTPPVTAPVGLHAPPSGIAPDEWDRRTDAVRDAAREFEVFSSQDASEWVKNRTKRVLTDQEVAAFTADVRQQVLTDLADILDQNERGKLRARRTVRVMAPKGYVRKTMKSLTKPESDALISRLKARGWSDGQVASVAVKHELPSYRMDRPPVPPVAKPAASPVASTP